MDITERKRAEESSARLNLELEQRIAGPTADLARINQSLQAEIEGRKKAEQALRQSEDRLRLAIDTIPELVWSGLPDGQIDYREARPATALPAGHAAGLGSLQTLFATGFKRRI